MKTPRLISVCVLSALVFCAAGIAVRYGGFDSPMRYDSKHFIAGNAQIFESRDIGAVIGVVPERPFFVLSLYLSHRLGGMDPFLFRVGNAVILAAAAMMVAVLYLLVMSIPGNSPLVPNPSRLPIALFLGLFFVVHPLQSLVVLYVWQREAIMACFFYVAAVSAYVAARSGRLPAGTGYFLTGLAFLGGMLSKENVVTVPVVLVLTELTLLREDPGTDREVPRDSPPSVERESKGLNARRTLWGRPLLSRIGVIGLITVPPFVMYVALTRYLHAMGSLTPRGIVYGITEYYHLSGLSPLFVALTECKVLCQYLGMVFVPFLFPVRLFQAQTISVSLLDTPWTLPACAGLLTLLVIGVWCARRHPIPAFGIFFFFVSLAPESSLIPQYLFFGYRAVLPMVGMLLVLGWVLNRIHQRLGSGLEKLVLPAVLGIVLLLFGTTSVIRAGRWNPLDFWSDEYSRLPPVSARVEPLTYIDVLLNYGDTLVDAGEPDQAIRVFSGLAALGGIPGPSSDPAEVGEDVRMSFARVFTTHPVKIQEALLGLAGAHSRKGDHESALYYLQQAVKLNPWHESSRIRLACALTDRGTPKEALEVLQKGFGFNAKSSGLHMQMGLAFKRMGKLPEAMRHYEKALEFDPRSGTAHNNLGVAIEATGDFPRALEHYRQAVRLMPDSPDANVNLAALLLQTGQTQEAIDICRRVSGTAPDQVRAHSILGMALLGAGRPHDAVGPLEKALELQNNDPDLQNSLGVALAESGNAEQAVRHFKKALEIAPDHPDARANLSRIER